MLKKLWLDNPLVTSMMFYAGRATPGSSRLGDVMDTTVVADDGVALGYRLYLHDQPIACVLWFHGNAETAANYDDMAQMLRAMGCALCVADYRGYGWSAGQPRASRLLPDAELIFNALPEILAQHDIPEVPLVVVGRSLGGASATHLAYTYSEKINGLILESTFAHVPSLLSSMGLPRVLLQNLPPLFGNLQKIGHVTLPTLIIHGELDEVIPFEQGEMLYNAAASPQKTFMPVPRAGHNNLVAVAGSSYVERIRTFIEANI